jgi:hypothetical protein
MGGETEKEVSGWTVDTLAEHIVALLQEHEKRFEQRFAERDHRYEQRFVAQEKATSQALTATVEASKVLETTAKEWRESSNEWRGAMTDRERNYLPRSEAAVLEKQNAERIEGIVGRLEKIEDRVTGREERGVGGRAAWGYVVGIIGALIAIVGLASRFLH